MPKKFIPNLEYSKAKFALRYIWHGGKPPKGFVAPEIRTNDPLFLSHGMPESEIVPTHVFKEED